MTAVLVK